MRVLLGLISLVSVVPQHMGSGDDVKARNTESVIESISPALPDGVRFSIVGSDTFVRVQSIGHDIQILGYEGEPYLRVEKSGIVQVNDSSQTTILNGDRYGNIDLSGFKKSNIPKWRTIATNGTAMWHDHRSHWMSPVKPAVIDNEGTVLRWSIPVLVDGTVVNIHGSLYLREQASIAWWLFAAVAGALAIFAVLKKYLALQLMVLASAIVGTAVGASEFLGLPSGAQITPILLMFSAAATVLSAVSIAGIRWKMPTHIAAALTAGAASSLLVAAGLIIEQIRAWYIPGIDNTWIVRCVLTSISGISVVAVVDAFRRITKVVD